MIFYPTWGECKKNIGGYFNTWTNTENFIHTAISPYFDHSQMKQSHRLSPNNSTCQGSEMY